MRKEELRKFLQRLTFQAADSAQVDTLDIRYVRQVLRQSEPAAVFQVDGASVGAHVADHADDGAGEDTWNTREGTFFQKVRTGAQRRALEIAFDVLTRNFHGSKVFFSTHVHIIQHRELLKKNIDITDITCLCPSIQHISSVRASGKF